MGDSGGGLTPRTQVEHRALIGQMPPNLAKVVLDFAILDPSVAVCGELGVPAQLRKIILKEYRLPVCVKMDKRHGRSSGMRHGWGSSSSGVQTPVRLSV